MKIYTFNDKVLTRNSKWLKKYEEPTPPTPSLPPYTIRMRFTDYVTPSFSNGTLTQVSSSPNIWDLTYENNDWNRLCESQASLIEVIDANTTGVLSMSNMFYDCDALVSVSLSGTSSVTNMNSMFHECDLLASVSLSDTSSVRDMSYMFMYCTSLTSVPLLDTSNVTDMTYMLFGCTALTSVPMFNTSNVTVALATFRNCTSLTSVPLLDTSNVTNMNQMFMGCSLLTSIPLFNTSKVTNMNSMFQNCYNIESGALALYQQASTQAAPPYNHTNTFTDCGRDTVTGAAELAQIPTSWGGTAS